jgi:hypothetical protein
MSGAVNYYHHCYFFKIKQFEKNAIIFWEMEPLSNTFNDGSNYPYEGISLRHAGKVVPFAQAAQYPTAHRKLASVVGNADGSVQSLSLPEYVTEMNASGRSRLWCVPQAVSSTGHP